MQLSGRWGQQVRELHQIEQIAFNWLAVTATLVHMLRRASEAFCFVAPVCEDECSFLG